MVCELPISFRDKGFRIEKGTAKAILLEESEADYYKWAETKNRDFDTALRERITIPLENRLLVVRNEDGSVKYWDPKLRFSGCREEGEFYVLGVGVTHFQEYKSCDVRAILEPEFGDRIREKGVEEFNDELAYFAMPFSVNGIPITSEGYVHLFRKPGDAEILPSYWTVIGGMVDTEDLNLFNKTDANGRFKKLVKDSMKAELYEEARVSEAKLEILGLSPNANFSHRLHINCSSREFLDGLSGAKDREELGDVAVLENRRSLESFLRDEEKIPPAVRGAFKLHLDQSTC